MHILHAAKLTIVFHSCSVRHWLGLFHTFESGCDDVNDGITDTAAEAFPSYGCYPGEYWDSCPNNEGPDPVFNFMGYNDDKCLYQWTDGQADKMRASFDAYRTSERSIAGPPTILTGGAPSEPITLLGQEVEIFSFPGMFNATHGFACSTTADNGDVDMFLNWDANLEQFDCASETPSSNENCSISVENGTNREVAFALVYASSTTRDFKVSCSYSNK
jgi:hypothetical protein